MPTLIILFLASHIPLGNLAFYTSVTNTSTWVSELAALRQFVSSHVRFTSSPPPHSISLTQFTYRLFVTCTTYSKVSVLSSFMTNYSLTHLQITFSVLTFIDCSFIVRSLVPLPSRIFIYIDYLLGICPR